MEKEENDNLRLEVVFDSPQYGKVGCLIKITDYAAVAKFSDVRLAKDMYNAEKKLGNKNQILQERLCAIFEKYPDKKKEQIAKELIDKFEKHNICVKGK